MKVWIARDKDGGLFMFSQPPKREDSYFVAEKTKPEPLAWWELPSEMLPDVTWENSPKLFLVKMDFFEYKNSIKCKR